MIDVTSVEKAYVTGSVSNPVLRGIDMRVDPGELAVILGPSGSGKTTLANLVGGVDRPDSGTVTVDDVDVGALDDVGRTAFRRAKVGFVFQFYNLVPNLTVAENVELVYQISADPMGIDEVLGHVGMLDRRDRFPRELSGGEQQRVALARALVKQPGVLVCDEPTGALDFETGRGILELVQRLNRERGTTTLLVTHNAAIAELATRVIRLRDGVVEQETTNASPRDAREVVW